MPRSDDVGHGALRFAHARRRQAFALRACALPEPLFAIRGSFSVTSKCFTETECVLKGRGPGCAFPESLEEV